MGLSLSHLVILLIIILIFGGARRLPELGGALGKGIRSFKKGLDGKDEESPKPELIEASATRILREKSSENISVL